MQHRALHDRKREINRGSAVGVEFESDRPDPAFIVESCLVPREKPVALARYFHVVVAKEPDLDRAPGRVGEQRRPAGRMIRLRFLPAERSAHSSDFNRRLVLADAEQIGN